MSHVFRSRSCKTESEACDTYTYINRPYPFIPSSKTNQAFTRANQDQPRIPSSHQKCESETESSTSSVSRSRIVDLIGQCGKRNPPSLPRMMILPIQTIQTPTMQFTSLKTKARIPQMSTSTMMTIIRRRRVSAYE